MHPLEYKPTEEQRRVIADLLEKAKNIKMTPEQHFEQRVSYVASCVEGLTKEQIRQHLIDLGYGPMILNPKQ